MEKRTTGTAITENFAKKMETINPFELENKLIEMADEGIKKMAHTILNAGRGDPSWVATEPRETSFLSRKFGLCECRHVQSPEEGIASIPRQEGIAARFKAFLKENEKKTGARLLKEAYNYMLMEHAADPGRLVHEQAESIIGDQYPVPDRILHFTELIIQDYLVQEMCDRRPPKGIFDLFATEGRTAAIYYVFDSLQESLLLSQGDPIALMVPIFTSYIEIPELRRYRFDVTEIPVDQVMPDGLHTQQYKDEDIGGLKNPRIKALFVTNPSNPSSYALNPEAAARIVNIIRSNNLNLMTVMDDVYGIFISHLRSLMTELPRNTLCVYSFSKYFGITGWRNAVIALHEDNIYGRMIARLSREQTAILNKHYTSLSLHPEKVKFIDHMVADSQQTALSHIAGLSLPQRIQMSLSVAFSLLDKKDQYRAKMQEIIRRRLHALWDSTGFTLIKDPLRAGYYLEIDVLVWAKKFYGDEFANYLQKTYNPLNIAFHPANETSLVLLNDGGPAGPKQGVHVSLANLNEADYVKTGQSIKRVLGEYAENR